MQLESIKYIGNAKILSETITDETTPSGIALVEVQFDSEVLKSKKYPITLLERLKTDEPIDATELRTKHIDPVVNQFIVLLQDNDVAMSDFEYLTKIFFESLDHKNDLVTQKVFGVDHPQHRTFLQIEKVINE